MQEAILQGYRRSARLLKRAAGLPETVTRAVHHHDAGHAAAAAGPKRRRRKAVTALENEPAQQEQQQQHKKAQPLQEEVQDRSAGTTDQLPVLGSITNRSDLHQTLDAAAATAAAATAAAAPPAKRGRGRPPRTALPLAAAAAAAEASTVGVGTTAAAAPPAGKASRAKASAAGKSSNSSSSRAASKSGSGPSRAAEQRLWAQGYHAVAGVDEAGRGPLAGPVVAAAAVLPPGVEFALLNDSKQMTEQEREAVYEQLKSHPDVSYAVAVVDAGTIDRINILQATLLVMRTAVEGLAGAGLKPDYLLIDGNRKPAGLDDTPVQTVVKGDASVTCIAAASVLAKVTRDRMMLDLEQQYPQYGFGQHKGYGVPAHRDAIQQHGPCPVHRRSFEPVKSLTNWPGYPKPPGPAAGTVVAARRGGAAGAAATGAVAK